MTGAVAAKFAAHGAVISVYSLVLIAIEELARRRESSAIAPKSRREWLPELDRYASALPWFQLGTVASAVVLCWIGLENGLPVAFTFCAGALAMFWSTRLRPVEIRVDTANALAVCATFSLTVRIFPSDPRIFAWLAIRMIGRR